MTKGDDLGIGRRVKALRRAHKMTLQDVADRADITKSYVWEIEQGKQSNPSIHVLLRLSKSLGTSLDGLVGSDVYLKPQLRPEAMRIAVEVDKLLRAALKGAQP